MGLLWRKGVREGQRTLQSYQEEKERSQEESRKDQRNWGNEWENQPCCKIDMSIVKVDLEETKILNRILKI